MPRTPSCRPIPSIPLASPPFLRLTNFYKIAFSYIITASRHFIVSKLSWCRSFHFAYAESTSGTSLWHYMLNTACWYFILTMPSHITVPHTDENKIKAGQSRRRPPGFPNKHYTFYNWHIIWIIFMSLLRYRIHFRLLSRYACYNEWHGRAYYYILRCRFRHFCDYYICCNDFDFSPKYMRITSKFPCRRHKRIAT